MLQITPQHRLLLATSPVDFRRGLDGLAALCRIRLKNDPFSGAIFAFRNRSGTSIKLLVYDGSGFWLCQKRFSKGRLAWWPSSRDEAAEIRATELLLILAQANPKAASIPEDWRRIQAALVRSDIDCS
ncbi:MAG: transposase [Gammaproteobacteria bacterium]|jgi:transposase|nr:transposase [Gammaproteobacteria bacterium]